MKKTVHCTYYDYQSQKRNQCVVTIYRIRGYKVIH